MSTVVTRPRLEYRSDSSVVAVPDPRISWTTSTSAHDWVQARAELEWRLDDGSQEAVIDGEDSVFVAWPFRHLAPGQHGALRVRVTGSDGERSDWSPETIVTAGFLGEGGWDASFVTHPHGEGARPFVLQREFVASSPIHRALLHATARGVYQAEINGVDVDDHVLKPGWTSYHRRLLHETTDVTTLLREGVNVLRATVAGGWYTEKYGFGGLAREHYGTVPSFAAQLVVEYVDGTTEAVTTDGTWSATVDGPLRASGIYAGEHYDARRRLPEAGPAKRGDARWLPAAEDHSPGPIPVASSVSPIRRIEELPVVDVITSPSGRTLLDFGQNLVGWLRIRVQGRAGDTVTLRHAEVLEQGELGVRPLRYAQATDTYTLSGEGVEVWEPRFTFHGFRYAEVSGWPGGLDPRHIIAVVVHSDLERTGWFETSHPLVNRLHENVVWGMRGNSLSIPTDCPQRDERMGWTGDIQVFAPTASFLFDCNGFLASWLTDLSLDQSAAGSVPHVIPDVLARLENPTAVWGDAATIVPSVLFDRFADFGVVAAQFDSMRLWTDQVLALAGERRLWEGQFQFGDWLDPDAPADQPGKAKTDPDLISTAYIFRSCTLTARAAAIIGRPELAADYSTRADEVRRAWIAEYLTPAGRLVSDAQTAYALAIEFELVQEPETIAALGSRLAELVRRAGYRIGSGFVGTPLILDALVRTGHVDAASRLLQQTELPSWLYPVTKGATTIWERWDSMLEDGSINPGEMTSFNHYAFGAVADSLHRILGGLAPAAPAYKRLAVAPIPLPGIDWARARHRTPFGPAEVAWERDGDVVRVTAVVPPNTTADVRLPGAEGFSVGSGFHEWVVSVAAPTALAGPVSTAITLAELIDDTEAYETTWRAIDQIDQAAANRFRRHTLWVAGRTLEGTFGLTPPAVVDSVAEALRELNEERTRRLSKTTPGMPR